MIACWPFSSTSYSATDEGACGRPITDFADAVSIENGACGLILLLNH
jgi:hypothetical protein